MLRQDELATDGHMQAPIGKMLRSVWTFRSMPWAGKRGYTAVSIAQALTAHLMNWEPSEVQLASKLRTRHYTVFKRKDISKWGTLLTSRV